MRVILFTSNRLSSLSSTNRIFQPTSLLEFASCTYLFVFRLNIPLTGCFSCDFQYLTFREEHVQKKIDNMVKDAKTKMAKGDKKGR